MNRKWIGLAATSLLVAACGLVAAQDKKEHDEPETPLGKIMEKVQKLNGDMTRYVRNAAQYKKSQKDLEKAALEFAKLAKESKKFTDPYVKNVKDVKEPQKKWDDIMDAWEKTSKDLAAAVAKDSTTQKEAKELFQKVKNTCADCHTVFRVEKEAF
ncbi:Cytochrome C' [Aquisphaera giovannonii]|uniref:Cytochrome C n=1 Tax=Aquisphaera giovannonii TaxID=406548 RepID=A0A5B9W7S9_9BACT|nr:cytochrome c [Aquisphaera giovannonii]QEH36294.1 Cytochrome C' [Aquisphaera giovannonii]